MANTVLNFRRHYHNESSSDQYSDSDTSFHADHPRIIPGRERGDVDGASAGSSPTSGSVHSPPLMMSSNSSVNLETPVKNVSKSKSADYITCKLPAYVKKNMFLLHVT